MPRSDGAERAIHCPQPVALAPSSRSRNPRPGGKDWRAVITDAVLERGGLATRQQLLERMPRGVLDSYIGRSHLVRVFPRVYRLRDGKDDDQTLLRAALIHAGPEAALSHTTALAVWGLRPLERTLHLTVDQGVKRA